MEPTRETPKLTLISQLKEGVRFTLKGIDGIYVKMPEFISVKNGMSKKKERTYLGKSAYVKESNKDLDLFYLADKPILKLVDY